MVTQGGDASVCDADNGIGWLEIQRADRECFARCPSDCHGHGDCYNASVRGFNPSCECDYPYYGSDCGQQYCNPHNCSGHGQCHASNGTCGCHHGFGGGNCSTEICPNGCSEAGICDYSLGTCACEVGREGWACELFSCPDDCR